MSRNILFSVHSAKRMFERAISVDDVIATVDCGDVIEDYSDDTPYPSKLLLGWRDERPLHIVAAENSAGNELIIVTVYEPDPSKWDSGFRRRVS